MEPQLPATTVVTNSEWKTLRSVEMDANPEAFWSTVMSLTYAPAYKQIHKVDILSKEVDGLLKHDVDVIPNDQLIEHQKIVYKRKLYPKDYTRKKEVEDIAVHMITLNRAEYAPIITYPEDVIADYQKYLKEREENNGQVPQESEKTLVDERILPHYYIQAEKYAFQMTLLDNQDTCTATLNDTPTDTTSDTPADTAHSEGQCCGGEQQLLPSKKYRLSFEYVPLKNRPQYDNSEEKLGKVAEYILQRIAKWTRNYLKGGYKKRVVHHNIVSLDHYTAHYRRLKEKYGYWVESWQESTDPQKFVFEDVGIAAFLIAMWELEREELHLDNKQSFVDIGAGNGFLTYLLTAEGHPGRGIDIRKRKIWEKYPPEVRLEEEPIQTESASYDEDWIIANHSDELTPWVPIIASRNNNKFWVMPCCEWDFDRKFNKKQKGLSRYLCYLEYVKTIAETSGFKPEVEHMKIPSTRCTAIVGRYRSIDVNNEEELTEMQNNQRNMLLKSNFIQFKPRFRDPSKTHQNRKDK